MVFHKRFLLPGILFFCLLGLAAQDSGKDIAEQYAEAERLIELLDYNRAISVLVEIVKSNPEEMEKAQGKIQDIREKKEEFNKKYEELITVLFEENNYEKGLQLIDELEQLDRNPNPATENSIKDARFSAELIYFRLLFNEMMDRAQGLIREQRYDQAVSTYLTGFVFHKRTYDERNYGDLIKGPVDKRLVELQEAAAEFLEGYEALRALDSVRRADGSPGGEQRWEEAKEALRAYAALRNTVWDAGWTFRRQNRRIGEISSEYKEDFFLGFAWRIVYGRTAQDEGEGMVRAMDGFWTDRLSPILEQLTRNGDAAALRADEAYSRGAWEQAETLFGERSFWAAEALEFNRLWTDLVNLDDGMNLSETSRARLEENYNREVDFRTARARAELFADLSRFRRRLAGYGGYDREDFPLMENRRLLLEEEIAALTPRVEEWEGRQARFSRDRLYTDRSAGELVSLSLEETREVRRSYTRLRGQVFLDMADFVLIPLEEEFQRLAEEQDRARSYLDGVPQEGEELAILYLYPQRALELLDRLTVESGALQAETEAFAEEYRRLREEIPQKGGIDGYLNRAEALLAGLRDARVAYVRLSRKADQNLALAQRSRNEGEYRYGQSEAALRRRDFSQAVQELTAAQDLFVQALAYNEDILSRDDTDRRIRELQARILAEENKEVIRFVRENVNQGKSFYLQGRYAQSEVVLLRAESRWFTTNTEPNSEINYWLNLVRAALSVESGRTIEDTEPLYAEMTQFLNLAYANFEEGRRLIEGGRQTQGLRLLDRADQNLNEILIPMPLNQAASVLKLRIQQLRDPELFLVVFSERYKSAVAKLRTEPDEAYIDLKDLAEIEPDYPGIGRAIYDAEIILGIRVPPPNPVALRQSEEFYRKAFAIVEGNVRSQFPVALAQLDRAIELNPNNSRAIELKDRIQLDAGGQTTIVLTSAAQSQFKNAEEKYINGEYFEAYAIVQQLLKNKDNAAYPPLQDLRRRIESKF